MVRARRGQEAVVPPEGGQVRLSAAMENYLHSLYVLREEGERATPGRLADHIRGLPATEGLGTTLPSVLGMLRRMAREGLVSVAPTKEVQLTQRGVQEAERVVRRHRLAERLVVDVLGLEAHKAHTEAHRLEHAISPDVEQLIRERLGGPTTCPFGRPIPGSGYAPPQDPVVPLSTAPAGEPLVVDRVPEEDPDLLRFLVEHGVLPGARLTVVEAGQYRGVLLFRADAGAEVALGYQAAAHVHVRRPGGPGRE